MADPGVFPFDDLPNELKLKVYEQYFSDTEIQLCHWDGEKKNFCFNGMKSLNLELTCKAICETSRKVRGRLISKTLLISEEDFLDKTMREFASSSKFAWLRGHVHGLKLALGCPLGDSHEFEGNWQKLINCLPNIQNVEICLPCAVMFAPMSEEHFNSRSAFEGWLGGSVRAFVSSGVGHEDIDLAGEYMLHELAIAMRATEENGRVKVSYRRWAVNPLQHSRAYFFIDTNSNIGVEGIKITSKIIKGDGIHACWHGKGEPHVVLDWELNKRASKVEEFLKNLESATTDSTIGAMKASNISATTDVDS